MFAGAASGWSAKAAGVLAKTKSLKREGKIDQAAVKDAVEGVVNRVKKVVTGRK